MTAQDSAADVSFTAAKNQTGCLALFTLGTRGSALALAQTELTRVALASAFPDLRVEVKTIATRGDQKLDLSLIQQSPAGGKGLFTKELEEALLKGSIDAAVHSLKDLPGHNPSGLQITAVLERASVDDVLLTRNAPTFEQLPAGAYLGTSSVRRARQLQWLRPDLQIEEIRGNVQTRLRKLGQSDRLEGIVLAQAGLDRLGLHVTTGSLHFEQWTFGVESLGDRMLPAIGQGAIAIQSRVDRSDVNTVLQSINHQPTLTCVRAERELQRLLAGDCALPVGVRTTLRGDWIEMEAILFAPQSDAASGSLPHPPASAKASGPANQPEQLARDVFAILGARTSA